MPRPLPRGIGLPQSPFSTSSIEDLQEVGPVGQEFAPQRYGILCRRMRHLVDEALHEEHVLGVAGRAPWPERHMRVLQDRGHAGSSAACRPVLISPCIVCGSRPS